MIDFPKNSFTSLAKKAREITLNTKLRRKRQHIQLKWEKQKATKMDFKILEPFAIYLK